MTDYASTGRASRRSRSSQQTATMGSPGIPTTGDDARIAELEARIQRLEGDDETLRERSRRLMDRVMPREASHHFRNAAREQLLGFRAIVDFWIARVDDLDRPAGDDESRQTITID